MKLTRRNLFAGASGALMTSMLRTLHAEAAGAPPKRLVVFQTANGMPRELYRQSGLPAAKDVKTVVEAPLTLREIMAPLGPYRQRMLIVEGLKNPFDQDLHGNTFAALSVAPSPAKGQPGGPSLDRLVAQQIGKGDAFSSVALATVWDKSDSFSRAADGRSAPYPAEALPQDAFTKLFAGGITPSPTGDAAALARARAAQRKSLVDFVHDDAKRVRDRVGGLAQKKMDQYLESLRAVERQALLQAESATSCKAGAAPTAFVRSMHPTDALVDAQVAIGAQALVCGITRVVNLAFGTSDGKISHYGFPALKATGSHHQYCHAGDMTAQAEIHTYIMGKVAAFLRRLDEVPEAGGTMLDNTLAVIVNDGGGTHHNGYNDIPLVIIGNGGGAFRAGRIISYPLGSRATCDAFLSVVNAMGLPHKTFGDPSVNKGPLTELA